LAGTAGKTILSNRVLVSHVLKPLWESIAGEEILKQRFAWHCEKQKIVEEK
jgi:hypothetical protein